MIWRKKYLFFLGAFGCVLFFGLILPGVINASETLSCEVRSSTCGDVKPIEIFQMYNTSNAHAALPVQGYNYRVCCGGVTGLGNSCSGTYAVALRLSGASNAHARQNTSGLGDYAGSNNACISVPSNKTISIGYQESSCAGYNTILGSMKYATNSHVGNADAYTIKICATVGDNAAPTLSVAQPDGTDDSVMVGDSYNITYTLSDPDDVVTAAFYYDTNNSGLDGTAITGACATAPEGTGATCSWDTTGVPAGNYYIYGITNDGINPQVSAYSPGKITISASTGQLSCIVVPDDSPCSGDTPVEIFQMYNTSNAHAAVHDQGYDYRVCCGGVNGLGNDCFGRYAKVLRLSGASNAHVRQSTSGLGDYGSNNACISVPSGAAILLGYQANNCLGWDTMLGSMIGTTNSHVGNGSWTAGTTKICASAAKAGLSTAIEIRNVADSADVSTITFLAGAPSAVISNPTGNVNVQVLTATASEAAPVAILKSAAAYTLWYNVTSTSNPTTWGDAVASEKLYVIAIAGELDLTTFGANAYNMTVWGTDQETTQALAAGVNKELYLQVTLSALFGKTGTSTLTILGEL